MDLVAPKRSHHAKPPAGEEQRKKAGCQAITSFFKVPPPAPKAGRPAGLPPKKRGRPAGPSVEVPPKPTPDDSVPLPVKPPSVLGKRAAASMVGAKLKRTNWGKGAALERMTTAVSDWDAKTGPLLQANKEMLLPEYAQLIGIPYSTLLPYARPERGKRKQLGKSVGPAPLFNDEEQQWAVDVIRRFDRGNDGKTKRECVDLLHDLKPQLDRKAVEKAFDRTVRPGHAAELTGIVRANSTTVKRTAITVAQQWRWHKVRGTGPAIPRVHPRAAVSSWVERALRARALLRRWIKP